MPRVFGAPVGLIGNGWPHRNLTGIFGTRKLDSPGYHATLAAFLAWLWSSYSPE